MTLGLFGELHGDYVLSLVGRWKQVNYEHRISLVVFLCKRDLSSDVQSKHRKQVKPFSGGQFMVH